MEHLVNLLNDIITIFSRIVFHIMQEIMAKAVGVAISRAFYGRSLEVDVTKDLTEGNEIDT